MNPWLMLLECATSKWVDLCSTDTDTRLVFSYIPIQYVSTRVCEIKTEEVYSSLENANYGYLQWGSTRILKITPNWIDACVWQLL
jgi:hypothetical protein